MNHCIIIVQSVVPSVIIIIVVLYNSIIIMLHLTGCDDFLCHCFYHVHCLLLSILKLSPHVL